MVILLEGYPAKRATAACQRAGFYGNYEYRALKDILRKGLDLEPLPPETVASQGELPQAHYARKATDFLHCTTLGSGGRPWGSLMNWCM